MIAAYSAAILLQDQLPKFDGRLGGDEPQTLHSLLASHVLHVKSESLHLLPVPQPAKWNSPEGSYYLYELADQVPADGTLHAATGGRVQQLYHSLLLSIKVGEDRELVALWKNALSAGSSYERSRTKSSNDKLKAARLSLEEYGAKAIARNTGGPAPLALGKAVDQFYGDTEPRVVWPDGRDENPKFIDTRPQLSRLSSEARGVRSGKILLPASYNPGGVVGEGVVGAVPADISELEIVEVAIYRPWLDVSLLRNWEWEGRDPNFFGANGSMKNIPVRLLLVRRPEIRTTAAVRDANEPNAIRVGPFIYGSEEVAASETSIMFTPGDNEWIVLGVISRRFE